MTKYILDTNVITELEDKSKPSFSAIAGRLAALGDKAEVYISILTAYEYQHGISKAAVPLKEDLRVAWSHFEERFPILPSGGNLQKRTVDFMLAGSAWTSVPSW